MAIQIKSVVPMSLSDGAVETLAKLSEMPVPEIVTEVGKDVTKMSSLTADEATKFLPTLFKNQYALASEICGTGRAIAEVAQAVVKVDKKAGAAILLGTMALGVGYYLWTRVENHERRIRILEQTVSSGPANPIGF